MVTLRPRDLRSRPSEEAVNPLPRELDTPPVTKTNLVIRKPPLPRNTSIAKPWDFTELLTLCFQHLVGQCSRFGRYRVAREHPSNLFNSFVTTEDANRRAHVVTFDSLLDDEMMIG